MLNFDNVEGLTVRKFCGLSVEDDGEYTVMCANEAVGEITAEIEGNPINIPVCQGHLDIIRDKYGVFSLDNMGGTLLE